MSIFNGGAGGASGGSITNKGQVTLKASKDIQKGEIVAFSERNSFYETIFGFGNISLPSDGFNNLLCMYDIGVVLTDRYVFTGNPNLDLYLYKSLNISDRFTNINSNNIKYIGNGRYIVLRVESSGDYSSSYTLKAKLSSYNNTTFTFTDGSDYTVDTASSSGGMTSSTRTVNSISIGNGYTSITILSDSEILVTYLYSTSEITGTGSNITTNKTYRLRAVKLNINGLSITGISSKADRTVLSGVVRYGSSSSIFSQNSIKSTVCNIFNSNNVKVYVSMTNTASSSNYRTIIQYLNLSISGDSLSFGGFSDLYDLNTGSNTILVKYFNIGEGRFFYVGTSVYKLNEGIDSVTYGAAQFESGSVVSSSNISKLILKGDYFISVLNGKEYNLYLTGDGKIGSTYIGDIDVGGDGLLFTDSVYLSFFGEENSVSDYLFVYYTFIKNTARGYYVNGDSLGISTQNVLAGQTFIAEKIL